jgi:RHS repeat-associated protein
LIQPEITDAFINSRTIDVSKPVGVTDGSANVSASGGATYSIPVLVPPGTNGMQPQLGIVYNSQAGDGPLGWGWGIAGLSVISRVGADWYHDSKTLGVTYTATDRFSADGQRLVMLSPGNYGANATTYDTENASFSVYTANGILGSGPISFSVTERDGTYRQYGGTADSRVLGDNGNSVAVWRLNKVRDPFGNYINYVYDSNDGESRLLRIDYTGNANIGMAPYNSIEFTYAPRTDKNEVFTGGSGYKTSNLLESVVVRCEGAVARTYAFNYSLRDINKSYLREVLESGAYGTALNSTIIKYGDPVAVPFDTETSSAFVGDAYDFYSGDYDGDGDSELLTSEYQYTEDGFRYNSDLSVFKRVGVNNFQESWSIPLAVDIQVINNQNVPQSYTANVSNDMNGDGRDDIVLGEVHFDAPYYTLQNFILLESNSSNASSFATSTYPAPIHQSVTFDIVYPNTFNYQVSGDFNGDGKGDLLAILGNQNLGAYHGFLYSPGANISGQILGIQPDGVNALYSASFLAPLDFDGDGAHEIIAVWGTSSVAQETRIYQWTTSPVAGFQVIWSSSGFPTPDHNLFLGDFNGDGKTDILNRYGNGSVWNIAYSTGSGFIDMPFTQFNAYVDIDAQMPDILTVADLNGDGMSDICHGRNVSGTSVLDLFYSRGMHAAFQERTYNPTGVLGASPALITDVNGDGRSEIINTTNVNDPIEIYFFDRRGHERSVQKVVNGMGAISEFGYGYMTEPAVHTRGLSFAYPFGDAQLPFEMATTLSTPDGIGGMSTTSYTTIGAVLDRTGRGFMGFKQRFTSSPTANALVVEQQEMDPNYRIALPDSRQAYRLDNLELLSSTVQDIYLQPLGNLQDHRFFLKLQSAVELNALSGATTTVVNSTWDSFGNITGSVKNTNNIEIETTTTTYVAAGPSSVPSRPQHVSVSNTRGSEPTVQRQSWANYDATTGAVTSTTDFYGTSEPVTTSYEYWTPGNLKQKITSYPLLAIAERPVEMFKYETKYRFVSSHKNVLYENGLFVDVEEKFTTDPMWGEPLSYLSSDGLTTLMSYDGFGRLIETQVPHIAGSPRFAITNQYAWTINSPNEYFSVTTIDPRGADRIEVKDLLGRTVKTLTEGFNSQTVIATTEFNSRGEVMRETTPHKLNEPFLTIEHGYDPYGRKSYTTHPQSGTTSVTYSFNSALLSTTVTSGSGQATTTITDATGKTTKVLDDGGELVYKYDSWGNLLRVSHDGIVISNCTFDSYGRQTALLVPGAGTTFYKYDPFGQLYYQKDPNTNEHTIEYDNLGRVRSRTGGEGTTLYSYYNNNGRMNNNPVEIQLNGVSRQFEYNDPYLRLTNATSVINGQSYQFTYAYDIYDHVIEKTYPSGFQIHNYFDADGSLELVDSPLGALFQGVSQNGLGQYTEFIQGDGRSVTKDYDHGVLTRIKATGVQDLNMAYDYTTANLSYRWDAMKALNEVFTYDDLNRLTSSTVSNVDGGGTVLTSLPTTHYEYDGSIGSTKGNLTMRSDIGQLGYASHNVVAAKNIAYPTPPDAPPFVISLETQAITYTPFLKTATIEEVVNGDNYLLQYEYGPEQQRTRSVLQRNGNGEQERVYLGDYEVQNLQGDVEEIHYITGGDGLCAIVVRTNGTWKAYSTYSDHLNSIVAVTDNSNGTIVAEQNFDPWGRRRDPATWEWTDTSQPTWLYRGYTGHEHVEPFALINMNGRMYDPLNGRMLSADNYVNGSSATQAFNRYSYAANNPLKYSDPSGNFVHILIGAGIGGVVNLIFKAANGQIGSWEDGFAAFGIGAAAGALGAATGGAVFLAAGGGGALGAGGFLAGSLSGMAGSAYSIPLLSFGNTAYFGDRPISMKEYAFGVATGGVLSGTVNGSLALLNGRSFWNGSLPQVRPTYIAPAAPTLNRPAPSGAPAPSASSNSVYGNTSSYPERSFRLDLPSSNTSSIPLDGRPGIISSPRPSISGYDARLAAQRDLYHSFPQEFDEIIIEQGAHTLRIVDQAHWFELPGAIDGRSGVYQIGMNDMGIIWHANFVP